TQEVQRTEMQERKALRQPTSAGGLLYREICRCCSEPCDLGDLEELEELKLTPPSPKDLSRVGVWLGEKAPPSSPPPANLKARDLLFLDTETTGLSRGAGTLAFMIGVGRFAGNGDDLEIDQIVLDSPHREAEGLDILAGYLDDARALVTFNGASFDLPVLRNRAVLCRQPHLATRLNALPHLDLLPPSRRLFGARLPNCRLGTLERQILGFTRRGDLPGAEVPLAYLRFLREGRATAIQEVLDHNFLDVAVLAVLLTRVIAHRFDPLRWAEDATELPAAGRIHSATNPPLALACFQRSLEQPASSDLRRRAWIELARLRRRSGDLEGAALAWDTFRREFPDRSEGWIELAKHHEHVTKELQTAMRFAQGAPDHARADIEHRLVRLRRRLAAQHIAS
ncbi:MAG: ribonuclease H-like domain-containing protein, partial [Deltaproteobacteria bacterium]|nr:ribonuclease H-like domain-containing protein [Deltaproteobacteria bacterium]